MNHHRKNAEDIDPSETLLVVVGAHLAAERFDRPTAELLRSAIRDMLAEFDGPAIYPLVCTDIWYLNNDTLRRRPTVALGGPEVNALTAHWASRLPSALAVDGRYVIQLDLEGIEPIAACWGTSHAETRAATEVFVSRFAREFLGSAMRR